MCGFCWSIYGIYNLDCCWCILEVDQGVCQELVCCPRHNWEESLLCCVYLWYLARAMSCFISEDFKLFINFNEIQHIFPALYHPSSNGWAECNVRTFKEAIKQICRFNHWHQLSYQCEEADNLWFEMGVIQTPHLKSWIICFWIFNLVRILPDGSATY